MLGWRTGGFVIHGRSCADHLSTLTQIIDSRKKLNQSTFIPFIDFSKAYDHISRPLLWRKLKQSGVSQKFLQAIQSLYKDVKCSVKINGHYSEWFNVSVGLKQGCLISPMLLNLYIDDLISEIRNLNCGVYTEDEIISILLYADDIALIATNEIDLQKMLYKLSEWCLHWKLMVNGDKTHCPLQKGPQCSKDRF